MSLLTQPEIAETGTTVSWLHATYKILLTPVETNGQLGMFETLYPPNAGPPRHVHHHEDETAYLLEGQAMYWVEGRTFTRSAGEAVCVPRGQEHTFRVIGDTPAKFITVMTPGGFESFFASVANRDLRVPEHMAQIREIAKVYNMDFTGPPLEI